MYIYFGAKVHLGVESALEDCLGFCVRRFPSINSLKRKCHRSVVSKLLCSGNSTVRSVAATLDHVHLMLSHGNGSACIGNTHERSGSLVGTRSSGRPVSSSLLSTFEHSSCSKTSSRNGSGHNRSTKARKCWNPTVENIVIYHLNIKDSEATIQK